MVGLLLVSHGNVAIELFRSAEMILGPIPQAEAIAIQRGDNSEEIGIHIRDAIDRLNQDDEGVVILTDMFGGTPTNLAAAYLMEKRVEIVTGVNLPMVLKFNGCRTKTPLAEIPPHLIQSGQQGILSVGDMLRQRTQTD